LALLLRRHVERALKCTDFVYGVVGRSHALARLLQPARHRSAGPFLRRVLLSRRSSVLCPAPTPSAPPRLSVLALYRCLLPRRPISPSGAGGSPQLTNRPSLHAISLTRERFRAAPESRARTAAFTQKCRVRPARSLTGCSFDAAEFTFVTACRYAPPRFDAGLSPDAGEFASRLLWRLAGAGLTPAGRLALRLGTPLFEPVRRVRDQRPRPDPRYTLTVQGDRSREAPSGTPSVRVDFRRASVRFWCLQAGRQS
jgi:hypothetical protein